MVWLEYLVWGLAVFFPLGWIVNWWRLTDRHEPMPRFAFMTILWWVYEVSAVYFSQSRIVEYSVFHLLWIMPVTVALAMGLDTVLIRVHLLTYPRLRTFLLFLMVGSFAVATQIGLWGSR